MLDGEIEHPLGVGTQLRGLFAILCAWLHLDHDPPERTVSQVLFFYPLQYACKDMGQLNEFAAMILNGCSSSWPVSRAVSR
jgi:hypothetical protein